MTAHRFIAVIDIGKTNAKVALVDLKTLTELSVRTRPNRVLAGPPYPHFDVEGHWNFILDALKMLQREHPIDGISITTHGACAALLDSEGNLAAPILDYEFDGPDILNAKYEIIRPPFFKTGSPRLHGGLNLGAQLHWQFTTDPELHNHVAHIVTYPQFWGQMLTGIYTCDVTSLGCHTDLWEPISGNFSSLPKALGIEDKIAPARKSGDILGGILPELARQTGIAANTPVLCGIHDSNASLYPYILSQAAPFSVVSTGTWVVAMSVGGTNIFLDPSRDLLLNVDAYGHAVPSARFMGGREFEIIRDGYDIPYTQNDIEMVLDREIMLLPAVVADTGPFQGSTMQWHGDEPVPDSPLRLVALSFYLALVTATCLDLIGSKGAVIVEGPFAKNTLYIQMLKHATGREIFKSEAQTGTAIGAALLFAENIQPFEQHKPSALELSERFAIYSKNWRSKAKR